MIKSKKIAGLLFAFALLGSASVFAQTQQLPQQQQQTVRSVVRALRIALTRLEGDFGVDLETFKKAE